MKITVGLSHRDVDVIRNIRDIADTNFQFFRDKEDSDDGLTEEEYKEYDKWTARQALLTRIEALIDNEIAVMSPYPTRRPNELVYLWDEVAEAFDNQIADSKCDRDHLRRTRDIWIKQIFRKFEFLDSMP